MVRSDEVEDLFVGPDDGRCSPLVLHRHLAAWRVQVDSEGEEVPLCTKCSMPVGEFAYQGREGKHTCVHTECMAQASFRVRFYVLLFLYSVLGCDEKRGLG